MNLGNVLIYSATFFGLFISIFFFMTLFENKAELKKIKRVKEYPIVSVIIPMYNVEDTVEKSIKTVIDLDYPKDKLEVVVVNDGSTDRTYEIAKRLESSQVRVFTKKNGGKASAINFGISKARGEFIGALDPDSFVERDALKKIILYFNEDPSCMAVTPSIKISSPNTFVRSIQHIEYLMGIFLRKIFSFLGALTVTPGPFTIFRRTVFERCGGFDEGNITEDTEMALKMQRHNLFIENCPDACIYTIGPETFIRLFKQRLRWYRGFLDSISHYMDLFGAKHGNLALLVLPSAFISIAFAILLSFYTLHKMIDFQITNFLNWYNIGFDISRLLDFKIDYFFINLSPMVFFAMLSLAFGIATIIFAKVLSKEKRKVKAHYVLYTFTYLYLFAVWWIGAIICKVFKIKLRWGPRLL